jgi:hypothetical protein
MCCFPCSVSSPGLFSSLAANCGHVQPILADGSATFATGFPRLLGSEFMRDAQGMGSLSTLAGNFSPFLYAQTRKAAFPFKRARWDGRLCQRGLVLLFLHSVIPQGLGTACSCDAGFLFYRRRLSTACELRPSLARNSTGVEHECTTFLWRKRAVAVIIESRLQTTKTTKPTLLPR